jgi:catechol 2,3-dioxygenase
MSTDTSTSNPRIDAATRIGAVHLTAAHLARSVTYYRDAIGLEVLGDGDGTASLGAGGVELVHLVEEPDARPSRGHTGLFHMALRVPERADLARWLAHAARDRVPLAGMSDHFVSEAIYLQDPDDHGIEIYHDRPRSLWEGRVGEMNTQALDVQDLLGELDDPAGEPFERLPPGTDMGHVHLRVADIPSSVAFYRDVLGFDLMTTYGPHAAFLSAGGYHHHIGANVWQSMGAPPPPAGTAALRLATILLPSAAERDRAAERVRGAGGRPEQHGNGIVVRDPSGTALLLTA